jgi:hypothetical protein
LDKQGTLTPHCAYFWATPPAALVVVVRALVVVVVVLALVVVALEVVTEDLELVDEDLELVLEDLTELDEEDPEPPPVLPPGCWVPEKVVPMGPVLMFEYTTVAPGVWLSTSAGLPEVVEHVPRATPGAVGSAVSG